MIDVPPSDDLSGPATPPVRSGPEPGAGMPRWVKGFVVAVVVLLVVLAVMLLTGHGPGRHMVSADPAQPDVVAGFSADGATG